MLLLLRRIPEEMANQYINTTAAPWLEHVAQPSLLYRFAASRRLMRQSRAMASLRKPVIVRKFSRDWCSGYAGAAFGQDTAELEILDLNGKVLQIGWEQVKWVCYVRDFPHLLRGATRPIRSASSTSASLPGRERLDFGSA